MSSRFIDQQQSGLCLRGHTCQSQTYHLATGKACAALTQACAGAMLQGLIKCRQLRSFGNLLGSYRAAPQRNIARGRAGKDMGQLTQPGHAPAQLGSTAGLKRLPVDFDTALLYRQKAGNLRQQHGFAAAAGTPQRHMLAGLYVQRQRREAGVTAWRLNLESRNAYGHRLARP